MNNIMKLHLFFVCLILNKKFSECSSYKAGVVEYYYDLESTLEPTKILENNLNQYVKIIEEFSQGWKNDIEKKIIVFPEMGLTNQVHITEVYFPVPDPNFENFNFSGNKILDTLSGAAKTYNTWVVVNMAEISGDQRYNTDVVFRNNGTIAARYRKYNLFGEKMDQPLAPDAVSFTTDFGVTFGIFTCFDILYSRPALDLVRQGINNFIFPTAWYSELPFLTSVQYQNAWAWSNNALLLASGLSYPKFGSTGSGIYLGKRGPLVYHQARNSYSSKLIMAVLGSDQEHTETPEVMVKEITESTNKNLNQFDVEESIETHIQPHKELRTEFNFKLLQESLYAYNTQPIEPKGCKIRGSIVPGEIADCIRDMTESLCDEGHCCDFNLTAVFSVYICKEEACQDVKNHLPSAGALDDFSFSSHRLMVFNGIRSFYVANAGVQICSVISCRDDEFSSCALTPQVREPLCFPVGINYKACVLKRYIPRVSIAGTFDNNNTFITPNILLGGSDIDSNQFGKLSNDFKMMQNTDGYTKMEYMSPSDHTPLSTVGIWNRVYDRDGQPLSSEKDKLHSKSYLISSSIPSSGLKNLILHVLFSIICIYPVLKTFRLI